MCIFSDPHSAADPQSPPLQHPLLEHAQSSRSAEPRHTTPGSSPVPSQSSPLIPLIISLKSELNLTLFSAPSSFRQCSRLSSRSPFTVWMGPTRPAPSLQTHRRHKAAQIPRSQKHYRAVGAEQLIPLDSGALHFTGTLHSIQISADFTYPLTPSGCYYFPYILMDSCLDVWIPQT